MTIKPRRVTVVFTRAEWDALCCCADNGWGNGDFADWLHDKRRADACVRALTKLKAAGFQQKEQAS